MNKLLKPYRKLMFYIFEVLTRATELKLSLSKYFMLLETS